jgi:GrpB-like predicted nucleotidyltransferase (UPF0157 family)
VGPACLQDVYLNALGSLILRVEHVGSTAVPGLIAKPILDIDLVMPDYGVFLRIVESLAELGYTHNGDQGIPQREAFKRAETSVPYTAPRRAWMDHHLYVCPVNSAELRRHIAFRDALRSREDLKREYEQAKLAIAARSNADRKTYARLKEIECCDFVEKVLKEVLPYERLRRSEKETAPQNGIISL